MHFLRQVHIFQIASFVQNLNIEISTFPALRTIARIHSCLFRFCIFPLFGTFYTRQPQKCPFGMPLYILKSWETILSESSDAAGRKSQSNRSAKKKDSLSTVSLTNWQRPTFPGSFPPSIIGAKELNYCVRDGNRCDLLAIVTGFQVVP